jgi:hypothetical protein
MVWFTIPFALATACGLASVALQLPLTADEAGSGLVPPAIATHIYGAKGALMITIMLFMAIVSTGSAESIAVSSVFSYDIYRTYMNPKATGQDIMKVSRIVVVVFGACMGVLGVALNFIGLNLGWVYLFMGIAIGSAVFPLWNLLMWKDASATGKAAVIIRPRLIFYLGAVLAAWSGMVLAVITWVVSAHLFNGVVSVESLGRLEVMLCGNLMAIFSSGFIHYTHSKIWPQNYDWKSMGAIELMDQANTGLTDKDLDPETLDKAAAWVKRYGYGFTILIVVIWPILSTPAGVFTKDYFGFWVFVALIWGMIASGVIVALPIIESWDSILMVTDGICGTDFSKADILPSKGEVETFVQAGNVKPHQDGVKPVS